MLFQERVENYAINFLEEEIKTIDELLKRKNTSDNEKGILEKLRNMYLKDLEELEKLQRKTERNLQERKRSFLQVVILIQTIG